MTMTMILGLGLLSLAAVQGTPHHSAPHTADRQALAFDAAADAARDVDAALTRAQADGRHVLIVLGGNWCHDSRALLDLFSSERFRPMLAARYHLVLVDVGYRDRNLAIAERFGLPPLEGTPTVLIVRADGTAINRRDAPRWRNAASRKPAAVYRHFERAVAVVGS